MAHFRPQDHRALPTSGSISSNLRAPHGCKSQLRALTLDTTQRRGARPQRGPNRAGRQSASRRTVLESYLLVICFSGPFSRPFLRAIAEVPGQIVAFPQDLTCSSFASYLLDRFFGNRNGNGRGQGLRRPFAPSRRAGRPLPPSTSATPTRAAPRAVRSLQDASHGARQPNPDPTSPRTSRTANAMQPAHQGRRLHEGRHLCPGGHGLPPGHQRPRLPSREACPLRRSAWRPR